MPKIDHMPLGSQVRLLDVLESGLARRVGSARALRHALERAVFAAARTGASEIRPEHLDLEAPASDVDGLVSVPEATRRHVLAVLHRMGGNRHRAAEILGMSERHLYRLLRRYQSLSK